MKPLADKLALVTGACGFAGSHMLDLLIEKGIRVRATDLKSADSSYVDKKTLFRKNQHRL